MNIGGEQRYWIWSGEHAQIEKSLSSSSMCIVAEKLVQQSKLAHPFMQSRRSEYRLIVPITSAKILMCGFEAVSKLISGFGKPICLNLYRFAVTR
jgi:hypothetical protein